MRKTETITIVDGGENKTFVVTAMSAMQQERFLIRAGVALAGTGILSVDTDASGADVMETLGRAIAKEGLKCLGKLNPDDLQPLLDMLLSCIKIKVGNLESVLDPATIDGQIEEFKTLFELRKIALRLSFSFLLTDANFTSSEEKAAAEISNKQKISRIS